MGLTEDLHHMNSDDTIVKRLAKSTGANAKFFMRRIDREEPECVAFIALNRFDPEVRLLPTNTGIGIGAPMRDNDTRRAVCNSLVFRLVEVKAGQARYVYDRSDR
jgi:hypothetical protein